MAAININGLRTFVERLESAPELDENDEHRIDGWMQDIAEVQEWIFDKFNIMIHFRLMSRKSQT